MTTQLDEHDIKNVADTLTEQDYNNNALLKQYPDIRKLIVTGLKSEIRIINNMNADDKVKERIRKELAGLDAFDLTAHVKLFNKVVLNASRYVINKAMTMSEMINRLIPVTSIELDVTNY